MSLLSAKSRAEQAREYLGNGRLDLVESTIATGEKFLAGLADAETSAVRAEFAALRTELAAMPSELEQRMITAAKSKIRQARTYIADKNLYGVEGALETAAKHLAEVREQHRTAVAADIETVKAEYAAAALAERPPAPTPPPSAPLATEPTASPSTTAAPTTTPVKTPAMQLTSSIVTAATPASSDAALTDAEQAAAARARGHVGSARSLVDSGRDDGVEHHLEQAVALLGTLPSHVAAPMRAQVDSTRQALASVRAAEHARRATGEIGRQLSRADSDIEGGDCAGAEHVLAQLAERIETHEIKQGLSTQEHAAYRARISELRVKAATTLKANALDRALPVVTELERMVATDPFVGLSYRDMADRSHDLNYLRQRVLGALHRAPASDPDVQAVVQRVVAIEQAVNAAAARWGKTALDASVSNTWNVVQEAIDGWEQEPLDQDMKVFFEPAMPHTRTAMQRTRVLLEDPETRRLRAEHPADAGAQDPFEQAERVFQESTAKLATAYTNVLAAAERIPTPLNRVLLERPSLIALGAEALFVGTPFQAVITARARKLDERWKAEVAAIMMTRQELYDELAAEAELQWPRLRETIDTVALANALPGDLVRIDRVYNRCGWDYGSRAYDFATRIEGVLIGGSYAPHVTQALEHAWYEQKLDVNDRIPWDVIAVFEGPDTIGTRTTVTLRDKSSGAKLGELEEWQPTPCVRVRIIGLHAGPVVVAQRP